MIKNGTLMFKGPILVIGIRLMIKISNDSVIHVGLLIYKIPIGLRVNNTTGINQSAIRKPCAFVF